MNEKLAENEQKSKIRSQIYHESPLVEPEIAPDFVKRLESAFVFTSSSHTFECVVKGSRPFDIKWFKNGEVVVPENNQRISTNFQNETGIISLCIHEANQSDNSLFSCRVSNELGAAETSAYLKVKGMK